MITNTTLQPLSRANQIIVPFAKVKFGGETFGLTDKRNRVTGVLQSDFITGIEIEKFGSGAVNKYTLNMKYVITPESDPNYVDIVLSKAIDRKISFTYGDISQPEYSYKDEQGIITNVVPRVDYKKNTIDYTITATSSTTLSYSQKVNFDYLIDQPSSQLLRVLYDTSYGLLDLLPGMLNKDEVIAKGWIPRNDKRIKINSKRNISPLDYILYLVSLMEGPTGEYFMLKLFDSMDGDRLPHFEIISTLSKSRSQMVSIPIGYPGSLPVYDFNVSQDTSIALMVEYRDKIENGIYQDYSFRGDLISRDYYSAQVVNGNPSANLRNWWDKMLKFPMNATLTTEGLFLPAEIIQSVYLDIFFFGKRYNHSGEYLITGQKDTISASGYRTNLSLLRISD